MLKKLFNKSSINLKSNFKALSNTLIFTPILMLSVITFTTNATDLKVGDKAPNFNLQATTGDYYNLKDFLGKSNVLRELLSEY